MRKTVRSPFDELRADGRQAEIISDSQRARKKGKILSGIASLAGAFGLALFGLFRKRIPAGIEKALAGMHPAAKKLQDVHSGRIGEYVAWIALGVGVLGGLTPFLR